MLIKKDIIYALLIFIIAFLLTGDLFSRSAQPATFDGRTHITQMAQYYIGLSQGQFPVTWADGFANYGMPIPIIAQQTINYLGGFINFITQDIRTAYNLVFLFGAFLSTVFFYRFLRFYFHPDVAFAGAFLFNFSSYRIINIYIRGALPEFFAVTFIPLSLIALYSLSKGNLRLGAGLLIFSTAMIIFTHPFMFIISLFLVGPYGLFLLYQQKQKLQFFLLSVLSVILGIGITAIYTAPLFREIKYFYYGMAGNHLVPNQFLNVKNYFDPNWYYHLPNDVFIRGNFIQLGLIETIIVITGILSSVILLFINRSVKNNLLFFASSVALLIIFFTTHFALFFYKHIPFLDGIQHPWRLLGVLMFIPPLVVCVLFKNMKYQGIGIVACILLIAVFRFPQLYGKNYTVYPQQTYFFTTENLHSVVLNTVWTGKTEEYPIQKNKPAILEGEGKVEQKEVKNGLREYKITAQTPLRMIDYTFYFPGWRVYVDQKKIPIEYQDPMYRGVITYMVPEGTHLVKLQFEPTLIRILGTVASLLCVIASGIFIYSIKKDSVIRKRLVLLQRKLKKK